MTACSWIPACGREGRYHVARQTRPGLIVDDFVCDVHLSDARQRGYQIRESFEDVKVSRDELRALARELLDAVAAYRVSPTAESSERLAAARRHLEAVLGQR